MAALAGVCAAVAIVGLAESARARHAARPAGSGPAARRLRRLAIAVGRVLGRGAAPPRSLAARLDAVGAPARVTAADVMAVKCALALAGALVAVPAASLAPGRLGVLVLAATPVTAFLTPDLALRRRARSRASTLEHELADVADLLRVALDAGLAPHRALQEVGRRHPGLLAAELRAVAARRRLGVPVDEALAILTSRAPIAGVAQLTHALERAAVHGAPLGPVLAAIAADARAERARAVRDRAARAAPQIQLVVALLLVPAVLLLVAAGLAAALL